MGGLKCVLLSDTHNQHDKLKVPNGDLLIHAGDVSGRGKIPEISRFLDWFEGQPHRYKIFIAGNHDWLFELDPHFARALVGQHNVIYLEDEEVEVEGWKIYGSPWQPEFCNWAFNLPRGTALRQKWNKIPEGTDILITHGPPAGIRDTTADGSRVGCVDLRDAVRRIKPKLHVFGHIHEAYGRYNEENTLYVNAANCDLGYNPINPPIMVELEQ